MLHLGKIWVEGGMLFCPYTSHLYWLGNWGDGTTLVNPDCGVSLGEAKIMDLELAINE